jgi:hypothetical protein
VEAKFGSLIQAQADLIEEINSDPRVQEMDRVEAERELAEFEEKLRVRVDFLLSKHGNAFSELAKLTDNPEIKDYLLNASKTATTKEFFVLVDNLRADLVRLKTEGAIRTSNVIVPWKGPRNDEYFNAMEFLRMTQKEGDDRLGKLGNEKLAETVSLLLDENSVLKRLYGSQNDPNNTFWNAFAGEDNQRRGNGRRHRNGGKKGKK